MFAQPSRGFAPQGQFMQPPRQQFAQPRQQFVPPQQLPPPPPRVVIPGQSARQQEAAVKPPIVRAKIDDTPAPSPAPAWSTPSRVTLPAPEHLGVTATAAAPRTAAAEAVDWNATFARLRQLGAVGWQSGMLPQGGYRFTCLLPTGQPNCSRHVEATGATEAEAVRLALARIEQQVAGQ